MTEPKTWFREVLDAAAANTSPDRAAAFRLGAEAIEACLQGVEVYPSLQSAKVLAVASRVRKREREIVALADKEPTP